MSEPNLKSSFTQFSWEYDVDNSCSGDFLGLVSLQLKLTGIQLV